MPNIILSAPAQQRQGAVNNRVERAQDQALYQAAEGLRVLSEAVGELDRRRQGLKASADAAQMQADLSVWLKEQEANGNVDNLGARLKEEKDKRLSNLNEKNGSMYYRQALDEAGVSVFASLIGQAENTEVNGRFKQQQDDLEKTIAANNTFVMNNPALWRQKADETEALINAAILPAETKMEIIKRTRHNFAYSSALTDLKANPEKLKKDVQDGVYQGSLSAEEQFNYLSGAENKIFNSLLEGDTVKAERFIKENKGYFKTIPQKAALDKIKAVRAANEKEVLEQDRVNRALFELDFWNDPSWGKFEAFDFRGDETKQEKWRDRLMQVPNPGARTVYNSVSEISDAIDKLAEMPSDTKEEQGKLIEKASDLTAAIGKMNAEGNLEIEDMRKYTSSIGKIAVNGTLRKDLQAMRPKTETLRAALKAANSIKNRKERIAAIKKVNRSEANAFFGIVSAGAEKILTDGCANFIKEVAAGNKDAANLIYKDTLTAARNEMYPFLADKEKGDVVTDDNGTVMVFAGYDGAKPVFNWGK